MYPALVAFSISFNSSGVSQQPRRCTSLSPNASCIAINASNLPRMPSSLYNTLGIPIVWTGQVNISFAQATQSSWHVPCGIAIRLGYLLLSRSEEHTSELQSRENLVC